VLSGQKLIFTVDLPGLKKNPEGKRKINYKWERGERNCLVFEAELVDPMKKEGPNDMIIVRN
jgi:hypothetical protein